MMQHKAASLADTEEENKLHDFLTTSRVSHVRTRNTHKGKDEPSLHLKLSLKDAHSLHTV